MKDYEIGGPSVTVAKRTQPLSVPHPTNVQPLKLGDPRNNDLYLAANNFLNSLHNTQKVLSNIITQSNYDYANASALKAESQLVLLGLSTEGGSPDSGSGNTQSDNNPGGQQQVFLDPIGPTNGGFIEVSSPDTITSDSSVVPRPEAAIPAPVYALDSPNNLYIDINSFIKNSDGSYTANLIFDPVPGAIKYNYRISATS